MPISKNNLRADGIVKDRNGVEIHKGTMVLYGDRLWVVYYIAGDFVAFRSLHNPADVEVHWVESWFLDVLSDEEITYYLLKYPQ